jgi:ferredoxin-NADP reductase/CRP-like cAMP-binding protein
MRVLDETPAQGNNDLSRLEQGGYFGEQELLLENKLRNDSIEAITDAALIKIPERFLKKSVQLDKPLEIKLKKAGHRQIINKIADALTLYEGLAAYIEEKIENVVTYAKGQTIFDVNDPSDFVYVILDGTVNLVIPNEIQSKKITIVRGLSFGELDVLRDAPRSTKVVAEEPVSLSRIHKNEFKKYYAENPKLCAFLKVLGNTYSLPHRGSSIVSFRKISERDTITTAYKLPDGRSVVAHSFIENNYFVMAEEGHQQQGQLYSYKKLPDIEVEIMVLNENVISLKCYGPWSWDNLLTACSAILDKKTVNKEILDNFTRNGIFDFGIGDLGLLKFICDCMSVEKNTIERLIDQGVNSLASISEKTGACTVCGSCRHRILSMLGQNIWLSVYMVKGITHNKDVVSYYIQPSQGQFNPFIPGQHIIIQLRISGTWIERAFTISDIEQDGKLRITIKKKDLGVFTNWLFNNDTNQLPTYVSQPQGNFMLKMDSSHPVLCFAGGVGVTPFITFAKSLLTNRQRKMHLVYVAPTKEDFIFIDEFNSVIDQSPSFKLTLLERSVSGYLTDDNIIEYIKNIDEPEIYICGPEKLESAIVRLLKKINYPQEKIHIEKFTYPSPICKPDT